MVGLVAVVLEGLVVDVVFVSVDVVGVVVPACVVGFVLPEPVGVLCLVQTFESSSSVIA